MLLFSSETDVCAISWLNDEIGYRLRSLFGLLALIAAGSAVCKLRQVNMGRYNCFFNTHIDSIAKLFKSKSSALLYVSKY